MFGIFEPHHEKNCFCKSENKGADHLQGNRVAIQLLCFRYIHVDSTILLVPESEITSVVVQPIKCWNCSEAPKTGFQFLTKEKESSSGQDIPIVSLKSWFELSWFAEK